VPRFCVLRLGAGGQAACRKVGQTSIAVDVKWLPQLDTAIGARLCPPQQRRTQEDLGIGLRSGIFPKVLRLEQPRSGLVPKANSGVSVKTAHGGLGLRLEIAYLMLDAIF
jgi:hypothetical protein